MRHVVGGKRVCGGLVVGLWDVCEGGSEGWPLLVQPLTLTLAPTPFLLCNPCVQAPCCASPLSAVRVLGGLIHTQPMCVTLPNTPHGPTRTLCSKVPLCLRLPGPLTRPQRAFAAAATLLTRLVVRVGAQRHGLCAPCAFNPSTGTHQFPLDGRVRALPRTMAKGDAVSPPPAHPPLPCVRLLAVAPRRAFGLRSMPLVIAARLADQDAPCDALRLAGLTGFRRARALDAAQYVLAFLRDACPLQVRA